MDFYLHAISLDAELKCINLAHSGTLNSLFTLQIFVPEANPSNNPINLSEQELRNCSPETVPGPASSMMTFLYTASFNRRQGFPVTEKIEAAEKRAEVEIQFELRRRIVSPHAPSRLSALYLVQNNEDGRMTLRSMLLSVLTKPKILKVKIINILDGSCLFRADHRWYEEYYNNPVESIIDSYWSRNSFDEKIPSWEYLLEGTIGLVEIDDFEEILMYAQEQWPNRFASEL